jgi:hypothetical protein
MKSKPPGGPVASFKQGFQDDLPKPEFLNGINSMPKIDQPNARIIEFLSKL